MFSSFTKSFLIIWRYFTAQLTTEKFKGKLTERNNVLNWHIRIAFNLKLEIFNLQKIYDSMKFIYLFLRKNFWSSEFLNTHLCIFYSVRITTGVSAAV